MNIPMNMVVLGNTVGNLMKSGEIDEVAIAIAKLRLEEGHGSLDTTKYLGRECNLSIAIGSAITRVAERIIAEEKANALIDPELLEEAQAEFSKAKLGLGRIMTLKFLIHEKGLKIDQANKILEQLK